MNEMRELIEEVLSEALIVEGKKKIVHKLQAPERDLEELAYTTNDPRIVVGRSPIKRKEWQILFLSDKKGPILVQGGFTNRTKALAAWDEMAPMVDGPTPGDIKKATKHLKDAVLTWQRNNR